MAIERDPGYELSPPETDQVRLLADQGNPLPEPRPPRLGLGIALVLTGGLLGWFVASLGSEPAAPAPTVADAESAIGPVVPRDGRPAAVVTWTEATAAPGIPAGYEYAGTSDAVEIDGTIYVTVNFTNAETGRTTSSLWLSDDGLEWVAEEFEVGEEFVANDLTATADGLYATGSIDNQPALFRSVPGRAVGGSSWNRIELAGAADMSPHLLTTEVDGSGDLITVAVGSFDVWRDLLQPLVPSDVDLGDPSYVLRDDGALFATTTENGVDFGEVIDVLSTEPEVVVTHDNVWVRLVTADGREVLRTVPLPDGAYPLVTEPPLNNIPLVMVWRSTEAGEFLQVTARSVLPEGFFVAHPWGEGMLAATFAPGGVFSDSDRGTLWTSASGRAWRPIEPQPPAACSAYSVAVSGTRIHLTGEDGTQCVRSGDSAWEVLADRNEVAYVSGGPAGFIGYPHAFEYDSALFSRDGVVWTEIEMPGLAPYPTVSILEDRLVALSVNQPRPNRPSQIQVWVGDIGS
jgi:hypothetical protein